MSTLPINTYEDAESAEIINECLEHGRSLGPVSIAKAAQRQGASLKWFTATEAWAVFDDRRVVISSNHGTESALAATTVTDKQLTKELLALCGIPVPAGRRVSSSEDAVLAQQELGVPVVVKPLNGAMGHGVTVNVTEPGEIKAGFSLASEFGATVLVEQYIEGTLEYRAHATPSECVGAFRRLLPSVVGDGRSTVAELIHAKNEKRKLNPSTRSGPIPLDVTTDISLRREGLTRGSVVPEGVRVVVRNVNGITSGGDSEECLDTVDESIKKITAGAVSAIPGMSWGGVDLLVEEKTGTPYVLEVNTNAAISGSTFPVFGTPRNLAETIWRLMYEQSTPEAHQKPRPPEFLEFPEPLFHPSSDFPKPRVPLSELLTRHLAETGYQITHHNSKIWSAQGHEGLTHWFNTVLTQNDLRTAVHPLRRPLLFRRIMREMGIPQPAARRLRSFEDLKAFRDKANSEIGIIPLRSSYGGATPTIVESDATVDASVLRGRSNWLAYVRSSGHRIRVVTTPSEILAVTAPRGQAIPHDSALEQLCLLAASAVRAVPHLRWAVVDVLLSQTQSPSRTRGKAVVERMTINPEFLDTDVILAGSLENVFDEILPIKR